MSRAAPAVAQESENWFFCSAEQARPDDIISYSSPGDSSDNGLVDQSGPGDNTSDSSFYPYAMVSRKLRWTLSDSISDDSSIIVLSVQFIDGTNKQHELASRAMDEWSKHIPIVFSSGVGDIHHIRVKFQTKVNVSSVGRDALSKPAGAPTMQLGALSEGGSEDYKFSVALHEFGHGAAALLHEHNHPDSGIKWNWSNLRADPRFVSWSDEEIRINITNAYSAKQTCDKAGNYDPKSIMHYPVQLNWVENGAAIPRNMSLSESDIKCARSVYADLAK